MSTHESKNREELRAAVREALNWSRLAACVTDEHVSVPTTNGHALASFGGVMSWPQDTPLLAGSREDRSARLDALRLEIAEFGVEWLRELLHDGERLALASIAEVFAEAWGLLARGISEGRADNEAAAVMMVRRVMVSLLLAAQDAEVDDPTRFALNTAADAMRLTGDWYGMNGDVGHALLAVAAEAPVFAYPNGVNA